MSHKIPGVPEIAADTSTWASLLRETDQEILASPELSDDEKHRLIEDDSPQDSERELEPCLGRPISETIIDDRGAR